MIHDMMLNQGSRYSRLNNNKIIKKMSIHFQPLSFPLSLPKRKKKI